MLQKQARHDMGEGGHCICPKCETRTEHRNGVPCQEERCAKCGAKLLREGSRHHQLWTSRRGG